MNSRANTKTLVIELLGLVVNFRPSRAHFRIPHGSQLVDSYPFPPKTAAVGMVARAIGLSFDGLMGMLGEVSYGVIVEDPGRRTEVVVGTGHRVLTCPKGRVVYVKPHYRMFLAGRDELMEQAYEGLIDPAFTPYLGDSERPIHQAKGNYIQIVTVTKGRERTLRSVIPAEAWRRGGEFMIMRRNNLTPRSYRVPIGFTAHRGSRREVFREITAFAGGFVRLRNPLNVLLFDGEPVFVF